MATKKSKVEAFPAGAVDSLLNQFKITFDPGFTADVNHRGKSILISKIDERLLSALTIDLGKYGYKVIY